MLALKVTEQTVLILTNAQLVSITVIQTQHAQIPMEILCVHVTKGTLVTELHAQTSMSAPVSCRVTLIPTVRIRTDLLLVNVNKVILVMASTVQISTSV